MNERDALLRSILDNPGCDTARLVFADYLDENGEAERAAWIRGRVNRPEVENGCTLQPHVHNCWWVTHGLGFDATVPGLKPEWYLYRRGFVDEIRIPTAAFLEHAEAIFRSHPVTRVRLVDATTFPSLGNDTFFVGNLGLFPVKYWRRLDGWKSTAICLVELDAVCVAYGREKAGLPELEPVKVGA